MDGTRSGVKENSERESRLKRHADDHTAPSFTCSTYQGHLPPGPTERCSSSTGRTVRTLESSTDSPLFTISPDICARHGSGGGTESSKSSHRDRGHKAKQEDEHAQRDKPERVSEAPRDEGMISLPSCQGILHRSGGQGTRGQ
ncbi:unnamed protein product [Prorocentrum cordatum]|uniref:Uncharacterized protein n=1 Tax=Prorocentrum cordatum TaxID=2364126 RepID=A0ABN9SCQ9_9DINO|nr:unnamed protein product [Polarella glacialis]